MILSTFLNLLDWWKRLKLKKRNMVLDGWVSRDFKRKLRKLRKTNKGRKRNNSNFNIKSKNKN